MQIHNNLNKVDWKAQGERAWRGKVSLWDVWLQIKLEEDSEKTHWESTRRKTVCVWIVYSSSYSVSSLVVPKMEDEFSGTDAGKNSKWPDKSWYEGLSNCQKLSKLLYDHFGGKLEQSDTAPLLLPPWQEEYWFFHLDLFSFQQLYFSAILNSISLSL